jgi:hypothetical protein
MVMDRRDAMLSLPAPGATSGPPGALAQSSGKVSLEHRQTAAGQ